MSRFLYPLFPLALLAFLISPPNAAAKGEFLIEDWNDRNVRTIAVLPWGYRQYDEAAETILRSQLERALVGLEYNFVGEVTFRKRAETAGVDTLFRQLTTSWKEDGVLDTEVLRQIGEATSVDAVLAAFCEEWEREIIEVSVRGNSWTVIGTRYSLYGTESGELLWSAEITEEGEGPYHDPSLSGVTGINRSGIQTEVTTSTQLDPPTYEEVAAQVGKTLRREFPKPPKNRD